MRNGKASATAVVRRVGIVWEVLEVFPFPRWHPEELLTFYTKYKDMIQCVLLEQPFLSFTRRSVSQVGYTVLGRYLQTLDILGIKYIEVTPREWQKEYGIKKTEQSSTKEQSIAQSVLMTTNALNHIRYQKAGRVEHNDNYSDSILLATLAERFEDKTNDK